MAVSVPCTLEPRGLCRSDGRRPDGISIIPWSRGRCLAWDATCHDTYAPSNIQLACSGPGLVADRAASAKRRLYALLMILPLLPLSQLAHLERMLCPFFMN